MRRIIRLSALSLTVLAVGCLGGYQPAPTGGANGPAQSGTSSNGNNQTESGTGSGGSSAAPAPAQTGGTGTAAPMQQGAAPPATAELIKFGQCMTQADWTSSGMAGVAMQMTDSGNCSSCHGSGMFSVYLSGDPTKDLTHLRSLPFLYKFAELETNPDGTFKDIAPAGRFFQRGEEITLSHPPYQLSTTNQQALTDFFNLTMTHYKAGNCTGQ